GGGEIRIERQAGALKRQSLAAFRLQAQDGIVATRVLPDDHWRQRLACPSIPGETAFALIVDANGIERARRLDAFRDMADERFGIVLDEARMGVMLGMARRMHHLATALPIDHEDPRAGGALIDGSDA